MTAVGRSGPWTRHPRARVLTAALLGAGPLALVAVTACGGGFSAGSNDDGGPGGNDGGGVIVVDGAHSDSTTASETGASDARHDAVPDVATDHALDSPGLSDAPPPKDGPSLLDAGPEAEAGCGPGMLSCTGGCVPMGVDNCGTCGRTCMGTTPYCSGGNCVSGCDGGDILCSATSTCVNTGTDPDNCNACGVQCPAGPAGSSPTCTGGSCGWACDQGLTECNGTSCILASPDGTHGVFVAAGGGPAGSCGSEAAPCAAISSALAVVGGSGGAKTIVYVAESPSPYVEEVTLLAGVTIQGGWQYMGGGQWAHPCALDPSGVVIQAPSGDAWTVSASYSGASILDTLTVSNQTPATTGQSLFGIMATGTMTTLTLANVAIQVAGGGTGVSQGLGTGGSAPGAAGACGSSTGAGGSLGQPGTAGSNGTYGATGYTPAIGGPGGTGTTALAGTPAPIQGQTGGPTCVYNENCCSSGSGGCEACTPPYEQSCGSSGTAGCPSGPSGGGAGGVGGGSSVGVLVWNATVTLGASIAVGAGGTGGNGGAGGTVQSGGFGAAGPDGGLIETTCTQETMPVDHCMAAGFSSGKGGVAGGQGGAGGVGGTGGGGAGGDSFCYVYAMTGQAPVKTGLSCQPAATAASGGTGGNPGTAGRFGTSFGQ